MKLNLRNKFDAIKSIFGIKNSTYQPRALGNGYSAGYVNSGYGSGSKFPGGTSTSNLVTLHNHLSLRQKVRDLMYDSMEARSIVESFTDVVVETGLKLKPTPDYDILGITPEQAEQWSEMVASSFHMWAKSKKSHRSRINNFYQNQRLYELFQQRDNDQFVRFYYSKEKDLFNPLQIDFLDPNQIRGYSYTSTYSQCMTDDGIVKDANGREIAYKIWNVDQNGKYTETTIPAVGEKSGRIFMLHGYNPEYAGQTRGYPRLSHLIQELENLTDFKASIIQKAINQASFIGTIENDEKDPSNPLVNRVAGPREYGAPISDVSTEQNNTSDATQPMVNFDAIPEATITQPGSVLVANMRRGDHMKYLQDTSPSAQYDAFETSFFASIAASVGTSSELVRKKFASNYAANRGTLILCWRVAQIWREEMASDFLDPTYEMWLSEEIASGRVQAPGWSDNRLRAAWLSCEWAGSPMPNIDPAQTAKADQMYIEMSAQTLDDVARNFNGSSGKANRMKNARQLTELTPVPWNEKQQQNNQVVNNNA